MKYTWKLKSLKKRNTQEVENVVIQTYWEKIGVDDQGNEGKFSGATPFDLSTVDPNKFISYEDLTEDVILGWIKSQVVGNYEQHVNEQIAKQISEIVQPIVEVTSGFPWQPEEEVIAPSPIGVATAL